MSQKFYIARHNDDAICKTSASGGAFTAITNCWFAAFGTNAVVYGCGMDSDLRIAHMRAEKPGQRDIMRGSKYVGSDMSGIVRSIEADLKNGKKVVFSGTPCQVAGLQAYLNCKKIKHDDCLLTVEVICHGVGSKKFFEDYIKRFEKRYKSKVISCSFRGKAREGKRQQMVLTFQNGKQYQSPALRYDEFYQAYLKNYILRPSCYTCRYSRPNRIADISLADYWKKEALIEPEKSFIIANSPQGKKWVEAARGELMMEEAVGNSYDVPNMQRPSEKPSDYDTFWEYYRSGGYIKAQKFLGNYSVAGRIKGAIAHIGYKLYLAEMIRWLRKNHSGAIKCARK